VHAEALVNITDAAVKRFALANVVLGLSSFCFRLDHATQFMGQNIYWFLWTSLALHYNSAVYHPLEWSSKGV
jgi:hypothetical protein